MTNAQILDLVDQIRNLTKTDIREILDIFGPCQASIDIANHITSARNLIIESQCQQCFDQSHKHDFDF
jgi:hypothetical protein